MKKLLLIRHGMPDEGNLARPHDPPLNEEGHRQAARLADKLCFEPIDRIVSSPQLRSKDTAAPLANRLVLPLEIVDSLAEIDLNTDRYRSVETIRREFPDRWAEFQQYPARFFGGDDEGFRRVVLAAMKGLLAEEKSERIAVFTHGTPIRTVVAEALELSQRAKLIFGYCSVTRIFGTSFETLRLESLNETLI
jgi:broad specificity phosphatase PhoE